MKISSTWHSFFLEYLVVGLSAEENQGAADCVFFYQISQRWSLNHEVGAADAGLICNDFQSHFRMVQYLRLSGHVNEHGDLVRIQGV